MLKALGPALVSEPDAMNRAKLSAMGCVLAESNRDLVERCAFVVLAVRPAILPQVLREVSDLSAGKCFLSIAAGMSTDYIRGLLQPGAYVLRAMPNMNLEALGGATALADSGGEVPEAFVEQAKALFSAAGTVTVLPEALFHAVTALSGSGPAYFFTMADAMIRAAARMGVPEPDARELAVQTMLGSALILKQSPDSPGRLAELVAVPGGTTEAALSVLSADGWAETLGDAMDACARRSDAIAHA
jgi:pyrroline-5-carboxylate reductase